MTPHAQAGTPNGSKPEKVPPGLLASAARTASATARHARLAQERSPERDRPGTKRWEHFHESSRPITHQRLEALQAARGRYKNEPGHL